MVSHLLLSSSSLPYSPSFIVRSLDLVHSFNCTNHYAASLILLPLALASRVLSHVLDRCAASTCAADGCARAVTGAAASPPITMRQSDRANFTVSTAAPVPTNASVCSGSVRYSSACSCWAYIAALTPTASPNPSLCLSDSDATTIVNSFASLRSSSTQGRTSSHASEPAPHRRLH